MFIRTRTYTHGALLSFLLRPLIFFFSLDACAYTYYILLRVFLFVFVEDHM